jgi:transposase
MECRHLDSNPDNNVLQNLQWGTRKENIADFKALTGRYAPARLTDEQAQQIREEFTGKYGEQRKLAQKFGVSLNIVNRIVRGKTYAAANSVSG